MNSSRKYIVSIALLVLFSAAVYAFQIAVFNNKRDTFFYLMQDLAFVPISVIFVTYIIEKMIEDHEKKNMLEKLNFVIGAFYSEIGRKLMTALPKFDPGTVSLGDAFAGNTDWSDKGFDRIEKIVRAYKFNIKADNASDLDALREFLASKREFLVGLLQNPNLLEHQTFTDLLMSVFHLMEELTERLCSCREMKPEDIRHIEGDIKRVFEFMVTDWVSYLRHLKKNYPYLFSFAVAVNPLLTPCAAPRAGRE